MAGRLRVVRTVKALRATIAGFRSRKSSIALVPTMGALHDGHISLVRLARRRAGRTVVSIFVNPAQFAPHEDFGRYPRTWKADIAALKAAEKTDLVFAPEVAELYPEGFATRIAPEGPALAGLEDKFRPHFFGGVATIVAKLLIAALPDIAIFGEKDYQQLLVIRRLVRDLALPIKIVGGRTVREKDGLALSSRNVYLTPDERKAAPILHRTLQESAAAIAERRSACRNHGARKSRDRARRLQDRLLRGASRRDARSDRFAERRADPAPSRGEARHDAINRQSRRPAQAFLK